MSRRGNEHNWSRPSNKMAKPRGLRGRDIGLYYRNQQIQRREKKIPKEGTIIHFQLPPAVLNSLENNLEFLKNLAKQCKMPIAALFPELTYSKTVSKAEGQEAEFPSAQTTVSPSNETLINLYSVDSPSTSAHSSMEVLHAKDEKTDTLLSLRGAGDYKYGYDSIITETFDEKLDKCLARGDLITTPNYEYDDFSVALHQDYKDMLNMTEYQRFKTFRERLPTYKKADELLQVINYNQVIVISGETGCGKSTQVPQIILDDAIKNDRGGYVKILVTQPRRIAASSLAERVAQERAEKLGITVGYGVRLEKVDSRPRGSIMFVTTGVLLATLEVDQGLSNYSHIILDEVHERDCDIDLAMFMLKKVLQKRKDLKLILMSATIDADTLSAYYDNCPMIHIEGLAYPVTDVYLETVLNMTKFKLQFIDFSKEHSNVKPWQRNKKKKIANDMEADIQYKAEIAPWLESIKLRLHPEVYKTLQDHRIEELNFDLIVALLQYICKGPPGAILVFLPGISDITKLLKKMQDSRNFPSQFYDIYPLHSKLPSLQQNLIFERPPRNKRKIIVATNIAETSITIDDIVYVIDSGKMKHKGLNVEQNVATLQTEWITQANLRQRRGRAGRCQPGVCYHLLTSHRAARLAERAVPELQRDPLLEPVLALKRLRLGAAATALRLVPAPPAVATVHSAVRHLQQLGALDRDEKLTALGWHVARLPVHPAAGKLLLLAALFGCLGRGASVAAVWGFKDPFQLVIGKEDETDQAKKNFALGEGSDHVAISEAMKQWESKLTPTQRRQFAYDNFLSHNTLELLSEMKRQLVHNLKQMGFVTTGDVHAICENRNNDNLSLFKALVAAALYPNIATTKWSNLHARNPNKIIRVKGRTEEDGVVLIHPSSVMSVKPPARQARRGPAPPAAPACSKPGASWLVYWHKQRSTELYLHEITLIHTLPLLFFGEMTVTEATNPEECFIKIGSVKVLCERHTAELLYQMRSLLNYVLASKIGLFSTHATTHNPFEEHVLNAVKELITAEDERAEYLNVADDLSESDNSEFEYRTSARR